jgi:hypothetical protein
MGSYGAQAVVPNLMSIAIVELLELTNIKKQERYLRNLLLIGCVPVWLSTPKGVQRMPTR